MTCKEYRDSMTAAVLGELNESDRAALDRHLADCNSCRTEYERLRRLTRALGGEPTDTLSEIERLRLENAVLRRLAERAPRRRPLPRSLIRIAAAVVLIGLGYFAHPLISRTAQPDPAAIAQPAIPSLALYERGLPAGSRFTPAGFKIIAHGRKAAIEQLRQAEQGEPAPR